MTQFNISFNEQQLVVLQEALVNLPYKMSAPLIAHITAQLQKAPAPADQPKDHSDKMF